MKQNVKAKCATTIKTNTYKKHNVKNGKNILFTDGNLGYYGDLFAATGDIGFVIFVILLAVSTASFYLGEEEDE